MYNSAAPERSVRFPLMFQGWNDLTFLHWRFPPATVARLVPETLSLETFDGSAWVGLTPFWLSGLRPPFLPAAPWLPNFPETNCRTYVRGPDGERGIWFFSLDAARALAVLGARAAFGLPYAWSRMRVEVTAERIRYQSFRHWPDRTSMSRIDVEPGTPVPSGQIEIFLTARYRLYSFIGGVLTYTQVEHAPWPLRTARIVRLEQTITRTAGLPEPDGPPLVHFSTGVTVRVAYPKPVHLAHRLRTAGRYTLGKA